MIPAEFRALLDKTTQVPWEEDDLFDFHPGDARAIVATMNRADLLAELWEAARRSFDESYKGTLEADGTMWVRLEDFRALGAALAKLEES